MRVVNDSLDPNDLEHAKQQVTDLFGTPDWRPILQARRVGVLDAERFPTMRREARARRRDRHEQTLGSQGLFTHEELVSDAPL